MKSPHYVEVFNKFGEPLIVTSLVPLPEETVYGNLLLKLIHIAQTIEYVNSKVETIFELFYKVRTPTSNLVEDMRNSSRIPILERETEVAIYFVRRVVDELISLIYILQENYPSQIKIDDIGKLLKAKDIKGDMKKIKDKYSGFLNQLNDISNAYKHSFLNHEAAYNLLGRDEPLTLTISLKGNIIVNEFKFDSIALNDTLTLFDDFVNDCMEIFKGYTPKVK